MHSNTPYFVILLCLTRQGKVLALNGLRMNFYIDTYDRPHQELVYKKYRIDPLGKI
jgi:hypothetical protein